MAVRDPIKMKPRVIPVRPVRATQPASTAVASDASPVPIHSESHWQIHRNRKRAILKEFPEVSKLYGIDGRTQFYAYAVILLQLTLAWSCRSSFLGALLLGVFCWSICGQWRALFYARSRAHARFFVLQSTTEYYLY